MSIKHRSLRLSRISHPRATLCAMILLALVFLFFGLVAQAYVPEVEWDGTASVEVQVLQSVSAFMRDWVVGV